MTSASVRQIINPSPLKMRFRIFTGAVTYDKSVVSPNARSITYGRIAGNQNVDDGLSGVQLVNFAVTLTWGDNRDNSLPLSNNLLITGTTATSRFFISWIE